MIRPYGHSEKQNKMKRGKLIDSICRVALTLCATAIVGACDKGQENQMSPEQQTQKTPISFSQNITKATVKYSFSDGDKIGIRGIFSSVESFGFDNDIYLTATKINGTIYLIPSETLYWEESGTLQVEAWYPYEFEFKTDAADQQDLLIAISDKYDCETRGTIALDFEHQLSQLKFAFKHAYTSEETVIVTAISVSEVNVPSAWMVVEEGILWLDFKTAITASGSATIPSGEDYTTLDSNEWVFMIVAPQTLNYDDEVTIFYTVDDKPKTAIGNFDSAVIADVNSVNVIKLTLL